LSVAIVANATAQPIRAEAPVSGARIAKPTAGRSGLESNEAAIFAVSGDSLWVAAGMTVSRRVGTGTSQFDWETFTVRTDTVHSGEAITAFAAHGDRLAVSTSYGVQTTQGVYGAGSGIVLSADGGNTWSHHRFTEIFADSARQALLIPNGDVQCYGLWFDGDRLWSAWTSEFAVMTPDWGVTWHRYRPDSTNNPQPNPFLDDPTLQHRYLHLNYRAYDGVTLGDTLWIGTNAGINRSVNGGITWENVDALTAGISGDFVPAMSADIENGIVWAATQSTGIDEAEIKQREIDYFNDGVFDELDYDLDRDGRLDGPGRNGVSWTADGGATWQTFIPETDPNIGKTFRAWNFAFDSTSVWVAGAASGGDVLLTSHDLGATWELRPIVTVDGDAVKSASGTGDVVFFNGILWVTTGQGLARSDDRGQTWQFVLTFPQADPLDGGNVEEPNAPRSNLETYAFPSPCSPINGTPANIVFALTQPSDVTVDIYDAGSGHVRTIHRTNVAAGNQTIRWNGRNESGRYAANGVYLYRITTADGHSATGKVVVLN